MDSLLVYIINTQVCRVWTYVGDHLGDYSVVIMVGPIIIISSKSIHLPNNAIHIVLHFSSPARVASYPGPILLM